jgi:hypothetical protein
MEGKIIEKNDPETMTEKLYQEIMKDAKER